MVHQVPRVRTLPSPSVMEDATVGFSGSVIQFKLQYQLENDKSRDAQKVSIFFRHCKNFKLDL